MHQRISSSLLLAVSFGLWSCTLSAAEPPQAPQVSAAVDTACPWGSLGDGKGHLIRCLTQAEAEKLIAESTPVVPAGPAPSGGSSAAARPPSLSAVTSAEPGAPVPEPPATPAPAPGADEELVAEIGAVTADQGTLPEAAKSLKKARDRFTECIQKNGGLTGERADVDLRFLVQGRGRAEGVSVKKRHGMTEVAAKCIADVVDRRYVGTPEEPMVGATLQVVISKKKR